MVSKITDQNFEKEVLEAELPVLVDFWAPWCCPCKKVSPVVDRLSESYGGRIKFCKVNIVDARITARKYGIMSIPTLMFFNKGKSVDQICGPVSERTIKPMIEKLL